MQYDASKVRVLMKLHSSNCASHKSTFSHYKEVSEEELREYLESFDEVTYKEETLYGACGRWFYVDDKEVAKVVFDYGEMCYYIYSKEGYVEKFECDCDMIDHEIVGFSEDTRIKGNKNED